MQMNSLRVCYCGNEEVKMDDIIMISCRVEVSIMTITFAYQKSSNN